MSVVAVWCLLAVLAAAAPSPSSAMPHCSCTYKSCQPELRVFECPFGEGRDPCDCCRVCLKGPGEACSPFDVACGRGFYCEPVSGRCRSVTRT
ncbi:single insulin-like growth factor-binding domain protein-2 [Pollicipes pollicipes]|uniref:single insulin-like growth factor-binding domain protein-2 n=1 Tax=Pollicipes pollicipes TaxID=41117 RepID=UPI00188503E6|nr:single insulin-like growth factor-binding domain protein-2 [Pollicipes pollicipes]